MNANAFQTAAELIAFHGQMHTVEIATVMVRRLASSVSVETVALVTFWAEVLTRAAGLQLGEGEAHHIRSTVSRERCAELLRFAGVAASKAA